MVNATFLNTDNHQHRQLFLHHPFREWTQIIHQTAPAASPFYHDMIDFIGQVCQAV
ncbi:Uncharacterised protein [Shigella sonnei]|nr:Uncharacterised protein [Shigella sonnei]